MFENDYLMHYGIKGQKWGVRRYQNNDGSLTAAGRARYSKGGGKRARYGRKDAAPGNIQSDKNKVWNLKKAPRDYSNQVRDDWSSTVYYSKGDVSPKLKKAALKRQLQLQKIYSKEGRWPSDFTNMDTSDYIIESMPDKKYRKAWNKMMYRDKQYSDDVFSSTGKKGWASPLLDESDYKNIVKRYRKEGKLEEATKMENTRKYLYPQYSGKKAKYGAQYMYAYPDSDGTSPLNTNKKLLKLNDKIAKNNKQLSKIDAYTLGQLNRYEDTYNENGGKDRAYLNGAKLTEIARKRYANKDTKLREKRQKLVDKITGTPNSKYEAVGLTDMNDVKDVREAYARGYSAYDPKHLGDAKAANFVTADWYYNQGKFKDYKVSPDSDTSKGDTYNTRAFNQLKYGKKKRK